MPYCVLECILMSIYLTISIVYQFSRNHHDFFLTNTAMFVLRAKEQPNRYALGEELGTGATATVYRPHGTSSS